MRHEQNRAEGLLARLRATLLPNCQEVSRQSSRALDERLPLVQRVGTGLHLLFCGFCRRYRTQLKTLRRIARESPGAIPAPPPLSDLARNRLKQSLRTQTTPPEARKAEATSLPADREHDHNDCH